MIPYRCPRCGQRVALGMTAPPKHPPVCCRSRITGHRHPPTAMTVEDEEAPE